MQKDEWEYEPISQKKVPHEIFIIESQNFVSKGSNWLIGSLLHNQVHHAVGGRVSRKDSIQKLTSTNGNQNELSLVLKTK